jgi:hypothetical protein
MIIMQENLYYRPELWEKKNQFQTSIIHIFPWYNWETEIRQPKLFKLSSDSYIWYFSVRNKRKTICGHWKKLRKEEVQKCYSVPSVIKSILRKNETFVMHEAGTSDINNTDIF